MLRLAAVRCYPLQQPLVALVLARHLQSDHAESPERHHTILSALADEGQRGANADQPEAGSKVRVVLQRQHKVAQSHGFSSSWWALNILEVRTRVSPGHFRFPFSRRTRQGIPLHLFSRFSLSPPRSTRICQNLRAASTCNSES